MHTCARHWSDSAYLVLCRRALRLNLDQRRCIGRAIKARAQPRTRRRGSQASSGWPSAAASLRSVARSRRRRRPRLTRLRRSDPLDLRSRRTESEHAHRASIPQKRHRQDRRAERDVSHTRCRRVRDERLASARSGGVGREGHAPVVRHGLAILQPARPDSDRDHSECHRSAVQRSYESSRHLPSSQRRAGALSTHHCERSGVSDERCAAR